MCPAPRARVEVVATALAGRLRGRGHRGIAQQLGVPASTVRGWLRRIGRGAEGLRAAAIGHLYQLGSTVRFEPTGSRLGDALAALAAGVRAAQDRLGGSPGAARPGLVWALLGRLGLVHSLASARAG